MDDVIECESYFTSCQATMMRELLLEKVREINAREKRRKEFRAELEDASQVVVPAFRPMLVA